MRGESRCNKHDIAAKTFSDAIYGGKRKALKAAEAYRDELLRRYSPYAHAIWVRTRFRRNNTSGVPGVGRYEQLDNPKTGSVRVFWLASWVNEQGDSRKRKFPVLTMANARPNVLPSQNVSVN